MNISFQIFEEQNLLIQRFAGEWSTKKYELYVDYSIKDAKLQQVSKILTDMRDLVLPTNLTAIDEIAQIRIKVPIKRYLNIHLVTHPTLTALTHIYHQESLPNEGIEYKYCSTLDFAIKLLKLDLPEGEIENRLRNLSNKME